MVKNVPVVFSDGEECAVVQGASDVRDIAGRSTDPGCHPHHTVQHCPDEGRFTWVLSYKPYSLTLPG